MEEKNKRRVFFSKGMKALMAVLFFISIGVFTVASALLVGLFQNGFEFEQVTKSGQLLYEETNQCGISVAQYMHQLWWMVEVGQPFTTKGELDPDKKIDIIDFTRTGKKMDKNTTYTVGNLEKMLADDVIVQFEELLFEIRNEYYSDVNYGSEITAINEAKSEEVAEEDAEDSQGEAWEYSQAFQELYQRGKELETYLPQSGISLAEYANENPDSVSLLDMYQKLVDAGNQLEGFLDQQSEMEWGSNVMYVVKNTDNGIVYTNLPAWEKGYDESAVKGMDKNFFFRAVRKNGVLEAADADSDAELYLANYFERTNLTGDNEEIVVMLNTDYPIVDDLSQARHYYEKYAGWGNIFLSLIISSFVIGIITLASMTIQAGRISGDKELHTGFGDGAPTEVMLAVAVIPTVLMAVLGIFYVDNTDVWDLFAMLLIAAGEIFLSGIFLIAYFSIVRRIKGKMVWRSSLCYAIVQSCKKVYMARKTSGRMMIVFAILMLGNIFAVPLFSGFGVLLMLIADGLTLLYLVRESAGRQVIRDGLARIASGELDFKIDAGELIGDNKEMAEAVNHVGDGLQNAVKETLKSERLKADLITNVSHDIKTPLTSIINYVDLLKRENIQDPKVKGYIDILDSKSQRLKQLTEDLVEASKISSGNVVLDMQPIRLGELVRQTNGEFEEKFDARNLEIVCRIPEEPVVIMADGRRMWRVIENLYNNVAKYAMPYTRVYVEVKRIGCRVIFEIKNVSENPLNNIRPEELTERFIRGDVSRNTEGSGLGLSIAQNLVKLQHGTFDIYLDGDLFKVTITFEAAGENMG